MKTIDKRIEALESSIGDSSERMVLVASFHATKGPHPDPIGIKAWGSMRATKRLDGESWEDFLNRLRSRVTHLPAGWPLCVIADDGQDGGSSD